VEPIHSVKTKKSGFASRQKCHGQMIPGVNIHFFGEGDINLEKNALNGFLRCKQFQNQKGLWGAGEVEKLKNTN